MKFLLNSVDIYFFVDTTGSMGGTVAKLIESLTTGNYLGTYKDACATLGADGKPDETLKNKGVTGAIACKIRDAAFGAGWFREVPWSNHGGSTWYMPFAHVQDISTDPYKTLTALDTFAPATSNKDTPEDGIVGLKAVATGQTQYMGWDRPGIPARTCDDPTNQFGYPCFRKSAVPVIMFITDAEQKNGPAPNPSNYGTLTGMNATPGRNYNPVPNTNEALSTAYSVLNGAPIDNQFITYTGDTRLMTARPAQGHARAGRHHVQ